MAAYPPRSLLAHLAQLPDPRDPKGRRFSHVALLAAACAAILCGAKSFEAIAQWARLQDPALMHRPGFPRTPPPPGAYRSRFLLRAGGAFETALPPWAEPPRPPAPERPRPPPP